MRETNFVYLKLVYTIQPLRLTLLDFRGKATFPASHFRILTLRGINGWPWVWCLLPKRIILFSCWQRFQDWVEWMKIYIIYKQKYSKTYFGTFCFNFCVRALHPTFCQSSHWSFSFGKNLRSDQRLFDNACSFCSLLVTCNRSPLKVFQHTHDVHLFTKNMVKTIE